MEELFDHPLHPYTQGLLKSVPKLGAHSERLVSIPGTVPNPARFPSGCKFHPRCHRTQQLAQNAPADQVVEISSTGQKLKVLKRCQLRCHNTDLIFQSRILLGPGFDIRLV